MTFALVNVEGQEGKKLLRELREHGFVMLVGSAVSDWEPSNLPPGNSLTSAAADLLSESLDSPSLVKSWIEEAAFEHVMEGCPDREVLGDNLLQLFFPENPNPLHHAIAKLVADGVIEHIVTTNYDTNLEAAARSICPRPREPQVIVTAPEASSLNIRRPSIFKIHGCVDHDRQRVRGEDRTMIYTLAREGELKLWKRQLLYRLVGGRRLLICGYSGRDFEICPELTRLQADIIWNVRTGEADLTPNARRVLTQTNGTALVGNMLNVLAELENADPTCDSQAIEAVRSTGSPDLKRNLSNGLTDWDVDLWRARTLVAIGAASEGIKLAESMRLRAGIEPYRRFEALLNLGRSQFHAGSYHHAIKTYGEAGRTATAIRDAETKRRSVLQAKSDMIEALRCHGNWLQAQKEIAEMRAAVDVSEYWAVAFRTVLLLRYYYQVAKALRIVPWVVRRLRQRCKDLLISVVRHAKDDHWLELQQAELWANRLDIPFSELYDGPMNPLPSKHGYKQLGYVIAQSMALRDDLVHRDGNIDDNIPAMIEALKKAGAMPELWKLLWVARRVKGSQVTNASTMREALTAWWSCEYTPLMRLFVTFFH
jgi:hypothetical protein